MPYRAATGRRTTDRAAWEDDPMKDIAQRKQRAAVARDLWQSVPLDCILCGLAVFLAAGLKLAGVLP